MDSEQAFQEAREAWRAALRGHVLAPPDAGFSARLAQLAAAAAASWASRALKPASGGASTCPRSAVRHASRAS